MSRGGVKQFDCVLTNPPYGKKTRLLKEDAKHFELGHAWSLVGGQWRKKQPKETNLYALFIERCLDMLKDGGRLAIVLPETVFHAPSLAHLRHYIEHRKRFKGFAIYSVG